MRWLVDNLPNVRCFGLFLSTRFFLLFLFAHRADLIYRDLFISCLYFCRPVMGNTNISTY